MFDLTFTKDQINLIRTELGLYECPDKTFERFIYQCQVSGLNPLLGHCTLVPRRSKQKDGWHTKWQFIAQKDGLMKRAQEFPDWNGKESGYILKDDDFSCDLGTGEVTHKFTTEHFMGDQIPVGAWARIHRKGKPTMLKVISFREYRQEQEKSFLWGKMPCNMIEKCAIVAALREAYPDKYAGIYDEAEMGQDSDRSNKLHTLPNPESAAPVLTQAKSHIDHVLDDDHLPGDEPKLLDTKEISEKLSELKEKVVNSVVPVKEDKFLYDEVQAEVIRSEARRYLNEYSTLMNISKDEAFQKMSENKSVTFVMIDKITTDSKLEKLERVVSYTKQGIKAAKGAD